MSIPYSRTLLFGIPWYSVLIVLGVVLAIWLAQKEEKRLSLPTDTALDIALVVVPCGIAGARLYYVLMSWEQFAHDPISVLYIWQGGIAIYGAVLGGALGAWIYARRKKLAFGSVMDMLMPGVLLAQAIGRWGNYFNMEAYGPLMENPVYQFFPLCVQISAAGGWQWHMATFFYESMWNLCGFAALWLMRKRQRHAGNTLCWYLLIYGSGRFVIEQLRQDSLFIGSLRASQYLSLILCAAAAGVLLWRACKLDTGKKFSRVFPACVATAAAAMARWFVLGKMLPYTLLTLAVPLCALWVIIVADGGQLKPKIVLVPLLVLDLLCLRMAAANPGDGVLQLLHALLCSATLPVAVGQVIRIVCDPLPDTNTKEERKPCPSES